MIRRTGLSVVVAMLLVALLVAGAERFSLAQGSATPVAQGHPLFSAPGVQTSVLASGDATSVSVPNPHLRLERITVPAGASAGLHTTSGPELMYVEDGTVNFRDTFGFSSTQTAPAHLLMAESTGYTIQNTTSSPASILRLSMAPGQEAAAIGNPSAPKAATPITSTSASPIASPVAPGTAGLVSPKVLLDAPSTDMPQGDVTMTIGSATWGSGASSGKQSHAGPLGVYVEQGTLNVTSPSGMEGQVPSGQSVILPSSAPLQTSNSQSGPAIALIATVTPTGQPTMSELLPSPTPTIPPAATTVPTPTTLPSPTSTPVPSPTNTPQPTPTPMPKAGTVLYEATGQQLSTWPKSDEWQYISGMLVSTGHNYQSAQWEPAPYIPPSADYAVEAEIQLVGGENPYFALIARGTPGNDLGYAGGFSSGAGGAIIADIGSCCNPLSNTGFDPGSEWHTYRLEVKGNTVTLLIDGALVLEVTNNTYLAAGRVGLLTLRVSIKTMELGLRPAGHEQAIGL